jgi:predicted TIM-barrel fold metal-dependent hydrolase
MREAGVDGVALVQFVTLYGYDNACLVDTAAAEPGRFIGVCSVDPFAPDAPDHLAALVQRGMRGLRLFTPAGWVDSSAWPDEPSVVPIVRRASELGLPVAVQLRPSNIPGMEKLARRFPDVRFLIDHLAGVPSSLEASADEQEALLAMTALTNVSLKFSTQNLGHPGGPEAARALFADLAGGFGPRRLLWGSNYPVARDSVRPYAGLVDQVRAFLEGTVAREAQELMLGDAAAEVYGLT